MLNAFEAMLSAFDVIVGFVRDIVTGIVQLLALVPQSMTFVFAAVDQMPPVLSVFALAGMSICLVLFLIGR